VNARRVRILVVVDCFILGERSWNERVVSLVLNKRMKKRRVQRRRRGEILTSECV
jgi:hypothetical protein